MTYRTGHGNGAGQPRIEVSPPDELPRPRGRPVKKGGATKIKLARSLVLTAPKADWAPYIQMAEQFRLHQCRSLAQQCGGFCGAAPSTMVASAAMQLAASRYMFDKGAKTGDMQLIKQASTIMNDSRQNLLAAYELAIREAEARIKFEKSDPHRALQEALTVPLPVIEPKRVVVDVPAQSPTETIPESTEAPVDRPEPAQ
jgi:hypothetical protein